MKIIVQSFLATVLALSSVGASSAEITSTDVSVRAPDSHAPAMTTQRYAQICLVNHAERAVLVGTSWTGEARNMAWILPGAEHMYRLEWSVPVVYVNGVPVETMIAQIQKLNVAYKLRGLLNRFEVTEVQTYATRMKTDSCSEMSRYAFTTDNFGDLLLVPAPVPVPVTVIGQP